MDTDADETPTRENERAQLTSGNGNSVRPDAYSYFTTFFTVIVIAAITGVSFKDGVSLFAFHPTLMVFGWLLFMASAVNAFSPGDITVLFFPNISHQQRVQRHWILQVCSLLCITAAFIIIITNKVRAGKEHFTSLHGCFGLTTFIIASSTVIGGVATLYSSKLKKLITPVYIKLMHSCFGIIALIFGTITMILPMFSSWWSSGDLVRYSITLMLIIILVFTILRPWVKFYVRITDRVNYMRSSN